MPFIEPGADELLREALEAGRLRATTDPPWSSHAPRTSSSSSAPRSTSTSTPIPHAIPAGARSAAPITSATASCSCSAARSTRASPRWSSSCIADLGLDVDVAFCPERIAEGKAHDRAVRRCRRSSPPAPRGPSSGPRALFRNLTDTIVDLEPEEAELAKLFTNTWRYIKFAAANQFYMMANDRGLDFERIRQASRTTTRAPPTCRAPGFAAGPCLFKDTMQLAAFNNNNFALGHSAMLVNEGLPLYLVTQLEEQLRPVAT